MSGMFLKQLALHRESLQSKLRRSGGQSTDQELAQTRQFLSATKDPKWRAQLIKRIKQLEDNASDGDEVGDVAKRFKLVDEFYQTVEKHPEYNKVRKTRTKR
ncbi:MAG TPA: hypothetical protein VGM77_12235 [Gemmatimonadales bacterium]|jgi:hypothetical protein